MVIATRKANEFKDEILAWSNEKFNALKTDVLAELKGQIKNELTQVFNEQFGKKEELEPTLSMIQEHVHHC